MVFDSQERWSPYQKVIKFHAKNVKMACGIFSQSTTMDVVMCTAMISGEAAYKHARGLSVHHVFRHVTK
ncbi:hypothetical protein M5689_007673 [Euphorbia peplus]|nr:hypothetical protein M5689_007673 [Euphorbia peplus]